ncbi:MAG: 3-deoxy-D-manno-octulosonic acid transferase [Paludibacteraceae bacterium]|nr:3-deoxy-D-manno-octulosonic acid transferase [Paludibacteraceae bacterium]
MLIYFLLIYIASLWNKKARLLCRGQKNAIPQLKQARQEGSWIWFHAASVGEFEQGRPVIERLRKEQPHKKILLTFFSPSGYELHKNYTGADLVMYLPFATRRNAGRFLDILQPEKAVFIKYEYWPAYLRELRKRGIETYSIASVFRKEQFFFRPLIGRPYRQLLGCFTRLLVQDEASRKLLAQYGITNTVVTGDPRFKRVAQIAQSAEEIPLVDRFVNGMPEHKTGSEGLTLRSKVLVAGSTWLPDEELIVRYINRHQDTRLILVPHETDEKHLHNIFQLTEGRYIRLTQANMKNADTCRILVVDTVGMLSRIYRYANVAYIGGGFGAGIHNTLEPAAYGIPVVWGKNYKRFREAKGLIEAGAGIAVSNYQELEQALDTAFLNAADMGQKALQFVLSETDAADKIFQEIFLKSNL